MTFAPFPPPAYLADGSRTEGEMKTAFENWLLATKQTSGHGQCRFGRSGPTVVYLGPHEGRRVLLNDTAYEVPAGGLAITNAGLLASTSYLAALEDDAGAVTLQLYFLSIGGGGGASRVVDPDSGITMVSFDAGATIQRTTTVVGMVHTNAASQFTPEGVASFFGRAMKTESVILGGDVSGGSASDTALVGLTGATFGGETLQCHASVDVQAQAGSGALVTIAGKDAAGTWLNSTTATLAANARHSLTVSFPLTPAADGWFYASVAYLVYSGAPVTVKAGSRLYVTRWA